MFELIIKALRSVWEFVKKVFFKIVSFVKNIVGFFKDEKRAQKLINDHNLIAVSIKEHLATGNYQVVNCLFNKMTDTVDKEDVVVISADSLDEEAISKFNGTDMLVLT